MAEKLQTFHEKKEFIGEETGRKEAPPGFEPGMADLQSAVRKPEHKSNKEVTATPEIPLAHTLAHCSQKCPEIDADLGRLIDAWPTLPEAIRAGIPAMVEAAGKQRA